MAANNFYTVVNKTNNEITVKVNGSSHTISTGSTSGGFASFSESGEDFTISVVVSGAPHNGTASSAQAGTSSHKFGLPTAAYGDNNPALTNSYTVLEVTQNGYVNMYSGAQYAAPIS
ncbi:MAG: hypothetical protein AAFQ98_06560 [Bacteroidota bacterium]